MIVKPVEIRGWGFPPGKLKETVVTAKGCQYDAMFCRAVALIFFANS